VTQAASGAAHPSDRIERVTYDSGPLVSSLSRTGQNSVLCTKPKTAIQDVATGLGFKIELPGRHPLYEFRTNEPLEREIIDTIFDLFTVVDPLYEDESDLPAGLRIGDVWKERLKETRSTQLMFIYEGNRVAYHKLIRQMLVGRDKSELIDSMARVAWKHKGLGRFFNLVSHKVLDRVRIFERVTGQPRETLVTNDAWSLWGLKTDWGVINGFEPEHGLHAWHILNLIKTEGVSEDPGIIELGGGIGSIAEKLYQWSDQPFTAFLVDLPLNVTTAYAFLARILGTERVTLVRKPSELASLSRSADEKQVVLLPTLYLEELLDTQPYEIVHNSASLSEMEDDIIEWYLEALLDGEPTFFIETNSNVRKNEFETMSRDFPVPEQYDLLGRFEANEKGDKYCTTLYQAHT